MREIGFTKQSTESKTHVTCYFFCRPVSGASMNPARSIGPALVKHQFKGLWVYIVGPMTGAIAGAFAYNLIRWTDKPLGELTKAGSFIKSASKNYAS